MITDRMVDAALDAWYPGEDYRAALGGFSPKIRDDMRAALAAADAAREAEIAAADPDAFGIYGCHVEMDTMIDPKPDDCVIRSHDYEDCIYAKRGMKPSDCQYWHRIGQPTPPEKTP